MINLLNATRQNLTPFDLKKEANKFSNDTNKYEFDPNLNLIDQQKKLRIFTTIIIQACYDNWIEEIQNGNFCYTTSEITQNTTAIKTQLINALSEEPSAEELKKINSIFTNQPSKNIKQRIYTKNEEKSEIRGHDQFFNELEKLMNGIVQEKLENNPEIKAQLQLLTTLYGLETKPQAYTSNRIEDGLGTFIRELKTTFAEIRKKYPSKEQFLANYKQTIELKELLIKSQLNLETVKLTMLGNPTEDQVTTSINRIKSQSRLNPNIGNTKHSGCPINHLNGNRSLAKLIQTIAEQYALMLLKSEKKC